MKKEEFIRKRGEGAYEKWQQQKRHWNIIHSGKKAECNRLWREEHPEKVKEGGQEHNRKGGKYYEQRCKYRSMGIPHKKDLVRGEHRRCYMPYKQIIAPESQLHHEWILKTADYRGVALVEANNHQHGIIDVIQILEGEITLFTEAEIRGS